MGAVPAPETLVAALRRAGVREVDASARRRAEYSADASNYRVVPQAVAFPRHRDEVAAALSVCREFGVPLIARGAGTSIAGNAVGTGLVLDFSRHLNRVLSVDPEARTAVAQPGAILDAVTASAAPHGLRFGPDPSTHARATVGGSLGNNACGSRALAYGRTADNVVALEALTADGASLTDLPSTVDSLVRERLALIRTEFGRFTRQVSGYSLEHLLSENGADVAKFLVGTEGTLAVIVEATLRLVEAPQATALAVLGYPDLPAAADAVAGLLSHRPVALEGMDARLADVVRSRRGAAAVPDLPRGGGWLFAETAGDTDDEARAAAQKLIADAGCLDSAVVSGPAARALWRIREDGAGLGGRTPAGEHGDGRARGELLPYMYSPEAIETFAAIKHAFDPDDLLNPGVIVRPAPLDADLRVPAAHALTTRLGFAYPHDHGDLSTAVHRCVGVGKCRADTTSTGGVMCPSYLATRDEKDSTRGRARVLQEMANGSLLRDGWRSTEVAESLDLCLSCKGCSSDCPAGVDMATYKAEALYQRYRRRPRPAAHYALGWLPRWARLASRAPGVANAALRAPGLAALAKRAGGIDARRPLPRFAG